MFVYFGNVTMNHYSNRRVEFKKAGKWYKHNSKKNDKMLIANYAITNYYARLSKDNFMKREQTESNNLTDLIHELHKKNVTYVYADDFYIRRLKIKDKNSTDKNKKAWLFKEVRDKGLATGKFKKVKEIIIKDELKGTLRGTIFNVLK